MQTDAGWEMRFDYDCSYILNFNSCLSLWSPRCPLMSLPVWQCRTHLQGAAASVRPTQGGGGCKSAGGAEFTGRLIRLGGGAGGLRGCLIKESKQTAAGG